MGHVDWNDTFKLGIPAVDHDHRTLFRLLDDFLEAERRAMPADELAARLGAFMAEAAAHFAREEELLDHSEFPALPLHRAEHDRLLSHLRHFLSRLAEGTRIADHANEAADYLHAWLLRHIIEEDQAYRPFLMRLA